MAGRRGVVIVGAINVDYVVATDALPRPGETVVGRRLERHGGGKGANAAVAAARMGAGAAVTLIGAVGDDDAGGAALDALVDEGIDVSAVARIAGEATGAALIVVDGAGENQIAVGAGANAALSASWVRDRMTERLDGSGCVLVSTEVSAEAIAAAVRAACGAAVPCVLNPAPVVPVVGELLGDGALLTPNRAELAELCEEGAAALAARAGATVVVTLGGEGAVIASPEGKTVSVPALRGRVRDTTGAGDTFNGVLAARLAAGASLADAVRWAVAAASLSVSAVGAREGMPSSDAVAAALGEGLSRGDGR